MTNDEFEMQLMLLGFEREDRRGGIVYSSDLTYIAMKSGPVHYFVSKSITGHYSKGSIIKILQGIPYD